MEKAQAKENIMSASNTTSNIDETDESSDFFRIERKPQAPVAEHLVNFEKENDFSCTSSNLNITLDLSEIPSARDISKRSFNTSFNFTDPGPVTLDSPTIPSFPSASQLINDSDISLADDASMSFKTFLDQTNIEQNTQPPFDDDPGQAEYYESKDFRITPTEIYFNRSTEKNSIKIITIESLTNETMYVEAVPSNHKLLSAIRSCGKLDPRDSCQIKVSLTEKAYKASYCVTAVVNVLIGNGRVEIPVMLIE